MQVGHEGEFSLSAGFPAEVERGHEVAELLAIEDHAVEDAVHEGLQGGGGEAVPRGDVGEFLGVLLRLEAGVAVADGGFAEALARLERADVFGDLVPLVHELGIGTDEADEFLAGHLRLARTLGREAGDEAHDVVVINHGGSEEDELEFKLVQRFGGVRFVAALIPLLSEPFGGFQILAPKTTMTVLRQNLLDGLFVFLCEVGVLVELRLEPLDFLELIDEGGLGCVSFEIRHGGRRAIESLRFHEAVELLNGGLQLFDDHWGLFHQPDFPRLIASLFPGEKGDGGIHGLLLLTEVENVAVRLGAVEHAIGA